jgi:hypothetical protein
MDRPESPLFVKAKTGRDVETQIESGDLFDFDLEVEPILEILVGKTLHVSMLGNAIIMWSCHILFLCAPAVKN